jgi:hypothetical protein
MAAGVLDGSSDARIDGSTDGAMEGATLTDGLGGAEADADGDAIGSAPQAASASITRLARMVRPIGRSPRTFCQRPTAACQRTIFPRRKCQRRRIDVSAHWTLAGQPAGNRPMSPTR